MSPPPGPRRRGAPETETYKGIRVYHCPGISRSTIEQNDIGIDPDYGNWGAVFFFPFDECDRGTVINTCVADLAPPPSQNQRK